MTYSDELTRLIDERIAHRLSRSAQALTGTLVDGLNYNYELPDDPVSAMVILDGTTTAVPCRLSSNVRPHQSANTPAGTRVALLQLGSTLLAVAEIGVWGYGGVTVVDGTYPATLAETYPEQIPPYPRNGQLVLLSPSVPSEGHEGPLLYQYYDGIGWQIIGGPVIDLMDFYTTSQVLTTASGTFWPINTAPELWRQGNRIFGNIYVSRASSDLTATNGNIADTHILTLDGTRVVRPITDHWFSFSTGLEEGTGVIAASNGQITIQTATDTIGNGANLKLSVDYVCRTT